MRERQVVAAIVIDASRRFLLTFQSKWNGYGFPMREVMIDSDVIPREAITALEDDLGSRLPLAGAADLDYLGRYGASARTGESTLYQYWVFEVDPGQPINPSQALTPHGQPPLFVDYTTLLQREDVTWSTREIARHVVETQEAALALVTRQGSKGTEYLMVWSNSYRGYFFPAARVRAEFKPAVVARRAIRSDLGYRGEVECTWRDEVVDVHYSDRFQCERQYRFHACSAVLPGIDLQQPDNELEASLLRGKRRWQWLTDEQLASPTCPLSPTVAAVRATIASIAASA